jgi:hypothetical protein
MQTLLPYVLTALALVASLSLFLALKSELLISARKQQRRMDQVTQRLEEAWERPVALIVAPQAARSSLNYSRRVQALRMARRGDDSSRIATVLGMSCPEVELLLRVQNMIKARIEEPTGLS